MISEYNFFRKSIEKDSSMTSPLGSPIGSPKIGRLMLNAFHKTKKEKLSPLAHFKAWHKDTTTASKSAQTGRWNKEGEPIQGKGEKEG